MRWRDRHDDELERLLGGESEDDERRERLAQALVELRETAPAAPAALRERVRALAEDEPEPRPSFRERYGLSLPRLALAAGSALAVVVVTVAAVKGAATLGSDNGESTAVGLTSESEDGAQAPPDAFDRARGSNAPSPPPRLASPPMPGAGGGSAPDTAPLPPTRRAQDYSARIRLHVDGQEDLSEAMQSAMRTTRELGGYMLYVDYGTSGRRDGEAELEVRIPIGRVQTAITRFAQLGTILAQQTEVRDLQGEIDRYTRDIQRRRDRIARLEAELRDPTLTGSERDRLEARLVQAKRALARLTQGRAAIVRQSRFARLALAFTTEAREQPAPPPGRLERALRDAGGVLQEELAIGVYILVVAVPFVILAALAWLAARGVRRAAEMRLLERA